MPISKAGTSNNVRSSGVECRGASSSSPCHRPNAMGGFTLLELVVVLFVLGSVLLIVFPKIHFFEEYTLRSEARRVAWTLRYYHESATAKKVYYRVWFNPEKESFEVESSPDGVEFTAGADQGLGGFTMSAALDMEDIVIAGLGRIYEGEAAVVFNPAIGAEPFNLHLKGGALTLTLSYNPYSGKVRIIEGYV